MFMFHYLVVLYHLTYLRLTNKDVVESAEALHRCVSFGGCGMKFTCKSMCNMMYTLTMQCLLVVGKSVFEPRACMHIDL